MMLTRIQWEDGTIETFDGALGMVNPEERTVSLVLADMSALADMSCVEVTYRGETFTDIPFSLVARVEVEL
jgi:hypothetical protein